MTTRGVATLVLCALIVAGAAAAQEPRPAEAVEALALPAPVRLTMTNGSRQKLELLRVEPGALLVQKPGRLQEPSFTVPLADVGSAERSLGRRRGRAAGMGALIGAVVGGAALLAPCDGEGCSLARLVTVPAYTILGAGIGALVAGERWEPLALPQPGNSRVQANHFSQQGKSRAPAVRLSFTIRF